MLQVAMRSRAKAPRLPTNDLKNVRNQSRIIDLDADHFRLAACASYEVSMEADPELTEDA